MNILTTIFFICAIIAFIDKAVGTRLGFGYSIDEGMSMMGPTTIAILGVSSVGVVFMENHAEAIEQLGGVLFFDPSMLIGVGLCPEMGAFALTKQITNDIDLIIFNGIIIAGLLGQVTSFQFPIFMASLDKSVHNTVIKGFIIGLIMIPFGLVLGAVMLKLNFNDFISEFIPVLGMCLLLALGMMKAQKVTIKIIALIARVIQIGIYLCLIIALVGIFLPSHKYVQDSYIDDALKVILQCTIIICGALTLSDVIVKMFKKQLKYIAYKIGVNEVSVVAFVLGTVNSLAVLTLYRRMDEKGKLMAAAFAVSGSFFLGGQMAFVTNAVADSYFLVVYLAAKVLCGFASLFAAHKLYPRLCGNSGQQNKL